MEESPSKQRVVIDMSWEDYMVHNVWIVSVMRSMHGGAFVTSPLLLRRLHISSGAREA